VFVLDVLALLLVAGDALQPSQRRNHAEQQMQLGVLGHMRLDEQRAALGIEPRREIVKYDLKRVLLDAAGVGVVGSQRMPISNEEKTIVLVLQAHPVAQRPNIIAEVQLSGGSHAAQDAAFPGWVRVGHQNLKNRFRSPSKNASKGAIRIPTMGKPISGRT